jgi:hypothetical protein
MDAEGNKVTKRMFEMNFADKIEHRQFSEDLRPLLASGVHYDVTEAARIVTERLLSHL